MARKRRMEISGLNVLFCLLVIFIHIISYPVSAFPVNTLRYNLVMLPWRLSSFVVQGFILLSGVKVFLNGKDKLTFGAYFKARISGVIVPYAVCFLIYYLCFMRVYAYPLEVGFILKHFLLGSLVCHLYFIPIIFQFDLLFPVWKRVVNRCSPMLVIPFAILASQLLEGYLPQMIETAFEGCKFPYNDRIFTTYLSYWLIGCYIGKYYDAFCEMLKKNFTTVCVLFAISLVAVVGFSYLAFNQLVYIPYVNTVHGIYVLFVCMFLYALALKIPAEKLEKIPFLQEIDGASFYIYLYHMLTILFAGWVLQRLGIQAEGIAFIIRSVLAYGLTLPGCILYRKLKKRVPKLQSRKEIV